MNSYNHFIYEFIYMNSYMNSCNLWIHMIFSYMNSYVLWIHIWIRVYQGSRCCNANCYIFRLSCQLRFGKDELWWASLMLQDKSKPITARFSSRDWVQANLKGPGNRQTPVKYVWMRISGPSSAAQCKLSAPQFMIVKTESRHFRLTKIHCWISDRFWLTTVTCN